MPSIFDAMLPVLYQRLGEVATYSPADASVPRPVRVMFDLRGQSILGGEHIADEPSLRIAASDVPGGVKRGDVFTIGGTNWQAREPGAPVLDGAEHHVPLARVRS